MAVLRRRLDSFTISVVHRKAIQLNSISQTELLLQVRPMRFDGLYAAGQFIRNFGRAHPHPDQPENLVLAIR
jgi:hypothetical protein